MFWSLLCAILVVLAYYAFIKPFKYWEERGVPQASPWKTWRGLFLGIIQYRPVADSLQKLYNDFHGQRYFGFYQFISPSLSIRDPDLIKQIMVKDFDHFVDHFNFFSTEDDPLWDRNLFFLKGEKWKEMRTTLSPSFTASKMKIMFGLMNDCGKQFLKYYEEKGDNVIEVEMKDVFTRFANDVIATTAFGVTCDSNKDRDNEFYLNGKAVTNFAGGLVDSMKFLFILIFPKLAKKLRIKLFKKEVTNYFKNVIKSNIKCRLENGIIRPDMIHLMLEARKGKPNQDDPEEIPKDKLNDDDIAAQAFIFFFAGFDSVATLMYFVAYELALQPHIQQKLQKEISEILNNLNGDDLTYDKLSAMKYMDMVLSETLRKWPSAIKLDRQCVKPYTIQPINEGENPVHLKAGDNISFFLCGIHRDPKYYPDPDRFDPERFSDENKSNINSYAYLPFGAGPRACIASRFALMETKVVFFHLLSKFDIVVTEKTPIPLKLSRTKFKLDNDEGFWMGLKRRKLTCQDN